MVNFMVSELYLDLKKIVCSSSDGFKLDFHLNLLPAVSLHSRARDRNGAAVRRDTSAVHLPAELGPLDRCWGFLLRAFHPLGKIRAKLLPQ